MNRRIAKKILNRKNWCGYNRQQERRAANILYGKKSAFGSTTRLLRRLSLLKMVALDRGEGRPTEVEVEVLLDGWREQVRPRVWRRVKSERYSGVPGSPPYSTEGWGKKVSEKNRLKRHVPLQRSEEKVGDRELDVVEILASLAGEQEEISFYDSILYNLSYYSDRWCLWRCERIDADLEALEAGER